MPVVQCLLCFSSLVRDAPNNSGTDQTSSDENEIESIAEEMKQCVLGQDCVSDGADVSLNTPVNVVTDAEQADTQNRRC